MIQPPYFTFRRFNLENGFFELRREDLTGLSCRISPERLKRGIDSPFFDLPSTAGCPFCPDAIETRTPVFPDKTRVHRGESVTFPNLYPFSAWHTVTVITREHYPRSFSRRQLLDAILSSIDLLSSRNGYSSLNWNYLPSSGASLVHPHLQALSDPVPSYLAGMYLSASRRFYQIHGNRYADQVALHEAGSLRYLFGDEIIWYAQAVPLGEKEIRVQLPISHPSEFGPYAETFVDGILRVIDLYHHLNTHAFNMSLFFDKKPDSSYFRSFCSIISRINPNASQTSDSAFMERIHREPVILTLPEDIGRFVKAP
jgi:UDPglucose--hexose-1-phosphate uridylyltransferase